MLAAITQEIKYGIYDAVCTNFLAFWLRTSFRQIARIIGNGNENTNVKRLVASVFLMILVKSVEKKYLNQSRPTNCEFAISVK